MMDMPDDVAEIIGGFVWQTAGRQERVAMISSLRAQRKQQKLRRGGVCIDCGGTTSEGKTAGEVSLRCIWCAQGRRRPANAIRLCVPVRLADVPLDVRLDAVTACNRIEHDEQQRLELLLAAIQPSDNVYWVAESARPLVEAWAA